MRQRYSLLQLKVAVLLCIQDPQQPVRVPLEHQRAGTRDSWKEVVEIAEVARRMGTAWLQEDMAREVRQRLQV